MRYTPQEKINSLINKIKFNLDEIEIVMKKLFPVTDIKVIKNKKLKSKK